jgi:hypothetical protein
MDRFNFDARTREFSKVNAYWLGEAAPLTYGPVEDARAMTEAEILVLVIRALERLRASRQLTTGGFFVRCNIRRRPKSARDL